MGIFRIIAHIIRHPLTWRVVSSLDELVALAKEYRKAKKKNGISPEEQLAIERRLDDLWASLKGC